MTNQYSTDALRSLLDVLGGTSEYRGAVLDFLQYVDITVPQDEPPVARLPTDEAFCKAVALDSRGECGGYSPHAVEEILKLANARCTEPDWRQLLAGLIECIEDEPDIAIYHEFKVARSALNRTSAHE